MLRTGRSFIPRERLQPCEYTVVVSRRERRPRYQVWPIRLDRRLPVAPVPLRAGDADAKLDLQSVLTTAYDRADPVLPLTGPAAVWTDALLHNQGLR